jgi:hypothetical protein
LQKGANNYQHINNKAKHNNEAKVVVSGVTSYMTIHCCPGWLLLHALHLYLNQQKAILNGKQTLCFFPCEKQRYSPVIYK